MTNNPPIPFDAVFRAELEVLRERRASVGLAPGALSTASGPSTENGLIGLALSGGGIRSATFSLGVLQSLARAHAFTHFDYLSTVSGGGFVGAAVSAALNRAAGAPFPFPSSRDGDTPELTHFRTNANYLNPGGLLSAARFPALLLRGVLLNVLALTPWLMLAVFLTGLGYVSAYNSGRLAWLPRAPLVLCLPFLLLLVTYPLTAPFAGRGIAFRERYERIFSGALLLLVLGVLLTGVFDAALWAIETPTEDVLHELNELSSGLHLPLVASALCMALVLARFLAPKTTRGLSRAGLYAAGALVPLACFALYLYECMTQVTSSRLPTREYQAAVGALPACGSVRPIPPSLCGPLFDRRVSWQSAAEGCSENRIACVECMPGPDRAGAGCTRFKIIEAPAHASLRSGPLIDEVVAEAEKIALWMSIGDETTYLRRDQHGLRFEQLSYNQVLDFDKDRSLIGLCLLVFLLYFFVLDANSMSLHGFYRDALSRLFGLRSDVGDHADIRVSALTPALTGAPYPIINATINVQGAHEGAIRDRSGAAFAITPLFSGGAVTGYARTADIEEADSRFGLASAVAISAAAAGPHMGSFTVRSLTLLLTLFNIRLGYWLPNPRQLAQGKFLKKPPGPRHIWREALGAIHARGRFVNVSDGGHFENLGAYELLRRKCSLIIVVDGEEDPLHQFNGFVRLLHLARVDLGVVIDADLAEIRQIANGLSPRHYLWADIRYGAGAQGSSEHGRLLYIKTSVTGDESPGLQAYRAHSPRFPHESTADQFFNEVQFEAYRMLGEHIGDEVLRESHVLGLLGLEAIPQSLAPERLSPKPERPSPKS
ncbi:MAG TPA: patatin-like phospholipase family protein [Polyangiaceae bacterium]|nr:patatin-like phospholipase family protein [Polyangiaceae bacterium]